MPFSESVKATARQKAHFRCVICREKPFVDVHHIVPKSEGGSNDLDNATALCAGCHDTYGNDPLKRKQIREMRDQWYDICEQRYKDPNFQFFVQRTDELYQITESIKEERVKDSEAIQSLKESFSQLLTRAAGTIETIDSFEAMDATSGYVRAATTLIGTVYQTRYCPYCRSYFASPAGTAKCLVCGKPVNR